jgi:hypothetical protein
LLGDLDDENIEETKVKTEIGVCDNWKAEQSSKTW